MEVLIERFNHTGEGIGVIDGKVIFVAKTIPGDIVEVFNIEDFKTYYKGEVKSFINYSSDRIKNECPYYDVCGGCQLMSISYLKQLDYKRNKVREILKKYAGIDRNLDIILSNKIYGYRNKITLQVENGKIGLYKCNSNKLVSINNCLLVSDKVNEVIRLMQENLDLIGIKNIMIREYQDNLMVQFIGSIDKSSVLEVLTNYVMVIYINDELIYGGKSLEVNS